MQADTGGTFGFREAESGLDRMHRWAVLLALGSPLAGLAILVAGALG
jgi:hypothetical protein